MIPLLNGIEGLKAKGNLDTDDIYIKCQYGNQIYYYGRNDLVAYIPSLGRGHNILRAIAADRLQIEDKIPYEELYPKLLSEGTVKHIMENDEEIEFHPSLCSIPIMTLLIINLLRVHCSKNIKKSNYFLTK